MSYNPYALNHLPPDAFKDLPNEELQKHVAVLTEWKSKATLQLEYFRNACNLYKLCDVDQVNELLNV